MGRRISWGFYGHQIKVVPHAFADANAFYSEEDQALMFGYFPGRSGIVFSCLSHDVIAHETAHALVDGLRQRYTDPSSPDQAAFHEGFADVVALLSVFSLSDLLETMIELKLAKKGQRIFDPRLLTAGQLRRSILFGLAEEMGKEMTGVRGQALRRSAELKPSRKYMNQSEFFEPHRRGEILVAAMMNAFLEVWLRRLKGLGQLTEGGLDRKRVAEEGADAADYLLTMSIRALDYSPSVDLEFCDFLTALLTADREIRPDDRKYRYRSILLRSFAAYGIDPTSKGTEDEPGVSSHMQESLAYDRIHFESMQRDPNEVFRFIWENREKLELHKEAYTRVISVRPSLRIAPDGFALRETIAEYIQIMQLRADELKLQKIRKPQLMPEDTPVTIYGGGSLIFDEYGLLKFHVSNPIGDTEMQERRLKYLWEYGFFKRGSSFYRSFSHIHRLRGGSSLLIKQNEDFDEGKTN